MWQRCYNVIITCQSQNQTKTIIITVIFYQRPTTDVYSQQIIFKYTEVLG